MKPPLAITGIGAVSAAGRGARAFREATREGRSCLGPVPRLEAAGLPVTAGGAVPEEALGSRAPGEDRLLLMCALAAAEALEDAGLQGRSGRASIGIALGTALGAVEQLEALVRADLKGDSMTHGSRLSREAAPHHDLTERLAARLELGGPRSTFSMTCASGLCALEQAAADLRAGRAAAVLVGGADALSVFMQAGFCALKALSPSGRLRPFQRAHDGIVLGEGAAFVLLEREEEARRRGAERKGLVAGNRLLSDAAHLTSPDESGEGMARAIALALAEAGIHPRELGGVTVTATGSPVYDRMQSRALRSALGPAAASVPVTTWEASIGHALASTSVLGMVHAAQALAEGVLSPVPSAGEVDPELGLHYLLDGPAPLAGRAVLALTVGFGGQNGATVVVGEEAR